MKLGMTWRAVLQGFGLMCVLLGGCLALGVFWQTNDDVGMLMIAEGVGYAAHASAKIVFSNVLYGHLVQMLPDFGGLYGYALATLLVMMLAGTAVYISLRSLGVQVLMAATVVLALMVYPMLRPQFTVNAGLLALAGMTAFAVWCRLRQTQQEGKPSPGLLVMSFILISLGLLVRDQQVFLVVLATLPLIALTRVWRYWQALITVLAIVFGFLIFEYVDQQAYLAADWAPFTETLNLRARINDYGGVVQLRERPELLAQYGYSVNDINLLGNWFLFDLTLMDPVRLEGVLSHLGSPLVENFRWDLIGHALRFFFTYPFLQPVLILAVVLALLRPGWRVAACWVLVLLIVCAIALTGRYTLPRVYYPLIGVLLIAPFFEPRRWMGHYAVRAGLYAVFGLALVWQIFWVGSQALEEGKSHAAQAHAIQSADLPEDLVVWGAVFPYESLFPTYQVPEFSREFTFRGLGSLTLAPFSRGKATPTNPSDIKVQLGTDMGAPFLLYGDVHYERMLDIYCVEHFGRALRALDRRSVGPHQFMWASCTGEAG